MNLATMRDVVRALDKQIKAAAEEETGGETEKTLDTGEMPKPVAPEDVTTTDDTVVGDTTTSDVGAEASEIPQTAEKWLSDVAAYNKKNPDSVISVRLTEVDDEIRNSLRGAVTDDRLEDLQVGDNFPLNNRYAKFIELWMEKPIGQVFKQTSPAGNIERISQEELEQLLSDQESPTGADAVATSPAVERPSASEPSAIKPVASPAPVSRAAKGTPAPSEDRWKPLADKLTEKGISQEVAAKVLEFFGSKAKKIKLVEDDILSEARPSGSADEEVKFTEWLKTQNFGDEINKKIIEALVEISSETKLISKTNLVKTLNKNMGYTKPRELSGQPKPSKESEPTADEQDNDEEEQDDSQWSEVNKNPEGWELTTVRGTTLPIKNAVMLSSGIKTYTVIKPDGAISKPISPDLIAVIGKAKTAAKTPVMPVQKPEIPTSAPSAATTSVADKQPEVPAVSMAMAPPEKTVAPVEQDNEQKAINHIKQKIKGAAALSTKQVQVRDLYKKDLVDSGNVTDLLNKVKIDPEVKDLIGALEPKPTGKILLKPAAKARPESEKSAKGELDISKLKLGGGTGEEESMPSDEEEEMPEDEIGGEEETPPVPKKTGKKAAKTTKTADTTEDLEIIKKKAVSILEKYAKREGKEGKDLETFINNIQAAENKKSIIEIFDTVLEDEENKDKASSELIGGPSKKQEPETSPEMPTADNTSEPEMTAEKLKYSKEQVEKILTSNKIKITPEIKKTLSAAEDESGLRDILFDNLDDATDAKMELTKALEDYDSKKVQKESLTRPMFVLKEGVFRLNK